MQPTGYLLCDDLMWMSRVMGIAKDIDCKIIPARTLEKLSQAIDINGPKAVLLDLSQSEITQDLGPLVAKLREKGITRLIAYGSHIETELLAAARQAGCDPVWARSKMADQLPAMLKTWLQP